MVRGAAGPGRLYPRIQHHRAKEDLGDIGSDAIVPTLSKPSNSLYLNGDVGHASEPGLWSVLWIQQTLAQSSASAGCARP